MPLRIALTVLIVSVLSACAVNVGERNLIIPTPGDVLAAGSRGGGRWTVEPLGVKAGDDAVLRGARFSKPGSVASVLYFGGNGFVLSKHSDFVLAAYEDLPVDVLMFDHRGYGANPGKTSMEALFADGVAIYDAIKAIEPAKGPLLVHGHSLGSFVAGHVASERRFAGLILESTATTTEDWVDRMAGAKRFLLRIEIDPTLRGKGNLSLMDRLDEPTLFVVGEKDVVTRPSMSQELFEAAAVPADDKRLIVVPGADHMRATRSEQFKEGVRWLMTKGQET